MNKTIKSVENMVDKLSFLSDKDRMPSYFKNNIHYYDEPKLPLSLDIFRKLKFTSISVMTNQDMINEFPDGLISSQFILINPNSVRDCIIHDQNMDIQQDIIKEENLQEIIVNMLKSSLTKNENDDINLIGLVSIYDKKESELMTRFSFKDQQLIDIHIYIKGEQDIDSLFDKINKKGNSKTIQELLTNKLLSIHNGKYPVDLFKAEQHTKIVTKEIKNFLTHYENTDSVDLKKYIVGGFIVKILPEMLKFRNSTQLKIWEHIAESEELKSFYLSTKLAHYGNPGLNREIRQEIALAANSFLNTEQRKLLIAGISSYSLIAGQNAYFSNIPKDKLTKKPDKSKLKP